MAITFDWSFLAPLMPYLTPFYCAVYIATVLGVALAFTFIKLGPNGRAVLAARLGGGFLHITVGYDKRLRIRAKKSEGGVISYKHTGDYFIIPDSVYNSDGVPAGVSLAEQGIIVGVEYFQLAESLAEKGVHSFDEAVELLQQNPGVEPSITLVDLGQGVDREGKKFTAVGLAKKKTIRLTDLSKFFTVNLSPAFLRGKIELAKAKARAEMRQMPFKTILALCMVIVCAAVAIAIVYIVVGGHGGGVQQVASTVLGQTTTTGLGVK